MAFLLSALPAIGSGLLGALKGAGQALAKGEGLGGALQGALKEGVKSATGLDVGGLVEGAGKLLMGGKPQRALRGERVKSGIMGKVKSKLERRAMSDVLRDVPIPLKGHRDPYFRVAKFQGKPYRNRIAELLGEEQMTEPMSFIDRRRALDL